MTQYRETDIAKKKINLSSIVITDFKLASQLKKDLEFCFSFLWQEHLYSKISGAWLCVYASLYCFDKKLTAYFQPTFNFSKCEHQSRVRKVFKVNKKDTSKKKINCCSTLLWPFFEQQVNVQSGIGSISMLMS